MYVQYLIQTFIRVELRSLSTPFERHLKQESQHSGNMYKSDFSDCSILNYVHSHTYMGVCVCTSVCLKVCMPCLYVFAVGQTNDNLSILMSK